MNEQELCKKRLLDLSRQADRKGIVLFSDFLNLNELNIYHQCENLFACRSESFGGIPYAERQMVAFLPDAFCLRRSYEEDYGFSDTPEDFDDGRKGVPPSGLEYPITALKVMPAYPKFAEKLGHRDLLGSIMNLGVERSKIGDILMGEDCAYILCEKSMAPYFMENLEKVRHTLVKLSAVSCDEITVQQNLMEKEGIITSNRLDAVIACVHKLSRSQALELLRQEKVFVNGKTIQNPTYSCQKDDIVSVRGFGRFIYQSDYGATNKGRLKIKYQLYQN
ncbi:MAG: hypothetical protein J5986_11395 [Roseburia sp.]|nr:hypothetical protein [Roseburia sp.]